MKDYVYCDIRRVDRCRQTFRGVWLWSRQEFEANFGEYAAGEGGARRREWTVSLEKNPGPDRGDEVPMGEIGETGEEGRLYKVRHPTMRKMQAEQI